MVTGFLWIQLNCTPDKSKHFITVDISEKQPSSLAYKMIHQGVIHLDILLYSPQMWSQYLLSIHLPSLHIPKAHQSIYIYTKYHETHLYCWFSALDSPMVSYRFSDCSGPSDWWLSCLSVLVQAEVGSYSDSAEGALWCSTQTLRNSSISLSRICQKRCKWTNKSLKTETWRCKTW